jgi:hypothetical protein
MPPRGAIPGHVAIHLDVIAEHGLHVLILSTTLQTQIQR